MPSSPPADIPRELTSPHEADPIGYLAEMARHAVTHAFTGNDRGDDVRARIARAEAIARTRAGATAQQAAARAITTVTLNANPHAYRSLAVAFVAVVEQATHGSVGPGRRLFTTDDVWTHWEATTDPNIRSLLHEPRAMGGLLRIAAERHIIRPTTRYVPGTRPQAHRRPIRLWQPGPKAALASELVPAVGELALTLDDWRAHIITAHPGAPGEPSFISSNLDIERWHHQRWSNCPGPEVHT